MWSLVHKCYENSFGSMGREIPDHRPDHMLLEHVVLTYLKTNMDDGADQVTVLKEYST